VSEVDEGLISGEQVILRTNKHWFAPVADSGIAVLMLLGVVVLAWLEPATRDGFLSFIWRIADLLQLGLFLGAVGWIVYNVVAWRTAEYAVTTLRVRGHEGLIKKRSTDSLLSSITDVFSKSGVLGRALGFGNIKILTASGDAGDDNFTSMKQPDAFKKVIVEQKMEASRPMPATAPAPVAAPAPAAPAPAPHPASSTDAMATLTELAKLRDAGAITPEEYEAKKTELLARI
jgi:membrane protein YdbS with pleckstrin-like domain